MDNRDELNNERFRKHDCHQTHHVAAHCLQSNGNCKRVNDILNISMKSIVEKKISVR